MIMTTFQHIVIATDFSESAARALDLGLTIAEKFDSAISLVHAVYIPPIAYAELAYMPVDDLMRVAQGMLDNLLVEARKRHPRTESVLVFGEPRERILEVARQKNADLITMGTHGRSGLLHLVLGSVAEGVVRLSHVPVLTVSTRTG
jgi:nucleotide-binding universal stress UspA family protein